MRSTRLPLKKRLNESLKGVCRFVCRPILPILPAPLTNRLPFLGRIEVQGPGNLRLRMQTHARAGKDRIAVKLGRGGFWAYEGETLRVFLALLRHGRVVVDVGANTGLFSLVAAKANPAVQVWAFEPVPFIADMLRGNIHLNGLTNVHLEPTVVAETVGDAPFFVTQTSVGIPTDSSSVAGFRPQVDEHRLPTTTLDAFMIQRRPESLDLLKIDTEAGETKVIQGARATLRHQRPIILCEILAWNDHAELQHTLGALAYQFFHILPNGLFRRSSFAPIQGKDTRNYLLVPAEKERLVLSSCGDAGISVAA
jgi:FkbM family methyltransferase